MVANGLFKKRSTNQRSNLSNRYLLNYLYYFSILASPRYVFYILLSAGFWRLYHVCYEARPLVRHLNGFVGPSVYQLSRSITVFRSPFITTMVF
jgi:hypothetical protein